MYFDETDANNPIITTQLNQSKILFNLDNF